MSFLDRVRETAAAATDATKKQTRRAQLEMRASRLESRVRREKTAIGEALYPLLASGEMESDLAEVQAALAEIETLNQQLARNATEIEALLVRTPAQLPPPAGSAEPDED